MGELDKNNKVSVFRDKIPEKMRADAFAALTIAILQEMFLSSITKEFIFSGMIGNLEKMGYSEKEIEEFSICMNEAYKKFNEKNDFMG